MDIIRRNKFGKTKNQIEIFKMNNKMACIKLQVCVILSSDFFITFFNSFHIRLVILWLSIFMAYHFFSYGLQQVEPVDHKFINTLISHQVIDSYFQQLTERLGRHSIAFNDLIKLMTELLQLQQTVQSYQVEMENKNYQGHPGYFSKRSINSRAKTYSPTSPNNNQHYFEKADKTYISRQKKTESDAVSLVHKENSVLKEENRILRRQLNFYRAQGILAKNEKEGKSEVNDLRQTIKKQAGQIKDLKTRLQILSKQCKMYEEIIDKMEQKINKLTQQNKKLQIDLQDSRLASDYIRSDEPNSKNTYNIQSKNDTHTVEKLKDRVNQIMNKYFELQQHVNDSEIQWSSFKERWSKQKIYYIHRIKDLENLMGISTSPSDSSKFKKRL